MIDEIQTVAQVTLWLILSHPAMVIMLLLSIAGVVHCMRNPVLSRSDKTLWGALLILLTPASLIAYVIMNGMKRRERTIEPSSGGDSVKAADGLP